MTQYKPKVNLFFDKDGPSYSQEKIMSNFEPIYEHQEDLRGSEQSQASLRSEPQEIEKLEIFDWSMPDGATLKSMKKINELIEILNSMRKSEATRERKGER